MFRRKILPGMVLRAIKTQLRTPIPIVPETKTPKKSWFGLIILCLLPLGVSLFGIGVSVFGINRGLEISKELVLLRAMQHWPETQACIRQLYLLPAHGREGPKIYVLYEYVFGGIIHLDSRVSLSVSGADVRRVNAMLLPYHRSGKRVLCYVNPKVPSEAYLFKNFWVGSFFYQVMNAMIITSVGLILMGMALCHFWRDRMIMEVTLLDGIHKVENIRNRLFATLMICGMIWLVNRSLITISGIWNDPSAGWGRKGGGLIYVSVIIGGSVFIGLARAIAVWQGRLKIDRPPGPRY